VETPGTEATSEVTASGFTEVGTAALEEAPKAEDSEIVSTLEDADKVESTTTTEEAVGWAGTETDCEEMLSPGML